MKYLKISNQGELDIRLIALMGGSTKTDDASKIGQFGTGLKYAISYLVRNEIKFHLFVGESEIEFHAKDESISGKDFKEIYCNGKSMNITTHYGYQWQAWEAIREIWCNATDEAGEKKKVIDNRTVIAGTPGTTIFFIEVTPVIKEVLDKWNEYFFFDTPLYEDDKVAIYKNKDKNLKLYKNGVLIQSSSYYNSLFVYDLKLASLNELRQYQGYLPPDIGNALLHSNKAVIKLLIEAIKDVKQQDLYEVKLDWSYLHFDATKLKTIFSGYLFLHPQSNTNDKSKGIKVNQSLFELLTKAGLPTERITMSGGGFYGGGGQGYQSGQIAYKEIFNPELQTNIQRIATKYGSGMNYVIAIPIKEEFEIMISGNKVIFNSSLENLSVADLEATVLIGIFHAQEHNMYKAFRRLIKFAIGNKNFRKILFGRNITDKIKPVYQPPSMSIGTSKIDEIDDFLPF